MAKTNVPSLRFLVLGAGAIGTYVGGSLVLAGQETVFLDRPEIAPVLRERGLQLQLGREEYSIHEPLVVSTLEDALEQGPFDVAVMAVKSYDTARSLANLAKYRPALPPILCLQNGVENEAALVDVLGHDKVIAGTVTSAVGRKDAGSVVLERLRGMGIAAGHTLSPALAAVLNNAGLQARIYRDAAAMKWSKMLTNLPANASAAILNLSPAQIYADARLYHVEIAMLREALRVMAAQHMPVIDLPGTPVRLLAWLACRLPLSLSRPLLSRGLGAGRGAKMPSLHIDLYAGRRQSEVDYLNGAVARFGERYHIATPVNRILTDTLMALVEGRMERELFSGRIDRFMGLFDEAMLR
jgi:2-dehydropantoate 2-reductase